MQGFEPEKAADRLLQHTQAIQQEIAGGSLSTDQVSARRIEAAVCRLESTALAIGVGLMDRLEVIALLLEQPEHTGTPIDQLKAGQSFRTNTEGKQ